MRGASGRLRVGGVRYGARQSHRLSVAAAEIFRRLFLTCEHVVHILCSFVLTGYATTGSAVLRAPGIQSSRSNGNACSLQMQQRDSGVTRKGAMHLMGLTLAGVYCRPRRHANNSECAFCILFIPTAEQYADTMSCVCNFNRACRRSAGGRCIRRQLLHPRQVGRSRRQHCQEGEEQG